MLPPLWCFTVRIVCLSWCEIVFLPYLSCFGLKGKILVSSDQSILLPCFLFPTSFMANCNQSIVWLSISNASPIVTFQCRSDLCKAPLITTLSPDFSTQVVDFSPASPELHQASWLILKFLHNFTPNVSGDLLVLMMLFVHWCPSLNFWSLHRTVGSMLS